MAWNVEVLRLWLPDWLPALAPTALSLLLGPAAWSVARRAPRDAAGVTPAAGVVGIMPF